MENVSTSLSESHHFFVSKEQMGPPIQPTTLMIPSNQSGHTESALKTELPLKRKAEEGPLPNNNSISQKKKAPAESLTNKKMARNDSIKSGSQKRQQQPAKKSTASFESASGTRLDSVRIKMKESLAAALTVAKKDQINAETSDQIDSGSNLSTKESSVVNQTNDFRVLSAPEFPQEFRYTSILPDEDVSFSDNFFAKDDLLQGNGLSWAFDFDAQMREDNQTPKNEPRTSKTPEQLASEIEAELFKLFGGVNKKYKEKGRSLLFNLKDPSNPELIERVISHEISPEKLCAMSAEELASKELSQWRTAKAEELAQMKVLPDTDVDFRRLVKKTHKGEYQVEVEVERDDAFSAEVSGGSNMLTQDKPKSVIKTHSPASSSENQDLLDSLIIPTDGTDLMQGIVVDELKDAEFLPPIVSLDEFMESLDTEPPFENLSADEGNKNEGNKIRQNSPEAVKKSPPKEDVSSKMADIIKKQKVDTTVKSGGTLVKHTPNVAASKVDYIWEGVIQLNISMTVAVCSLFQSGEKTSTKDWPTCLEIKGRVRLDSFEKFLQDLPMSRTRAVMVIGFDLKDKSSEYDRANLSEAIESYASDERLGYAEPAAGVELYLCPQISKINDMLKHVSKERTETNNSVENGLIGVVVWRRAHISNMTSPNSSSSHNKHMLKKQQPIAPPKRVQDSSKLNVNVNISSSTQTRPSPHMFNNVLPETELEDDIPPGFGPMAVAKDDDDLPEFNFSSKLNPSSTSSRISPQNLNHGVDKVRELIKKYGQSEPKENNNRGGGVKPWEDDDDIPEWQPQLPLGHHHFPAVNGQRPPISQPPPAGRWVQPPRGRARSGRWRGQ